MTQNQLLVVLVPLLNEVKMKVYDDLNFDYWKFHRDLLYFQYKGIDTSRRYFTYKELFLKSVLDNEDLYMHKILKMFREKYVVNEPWSIEYFTRRQFNILHTNQSNTGSIICLFLHRNPETNHYIYNFKEDKKYSIRDGQYIIFGNEVNDQENPCILINGNWDLNKKGVSRNNDPNHFDNLWKISFKMVNQVSSNDLKE